MHPNESIAPIKRAAISDADGTADIVAAVTGKSIRVLALAVTIITANGTLKWQCGASTDLTGAMPFGASAGMVLPYNPVGWFQTVQGEKLNSVGATTGAIAGLVVYQEV